ncbi:MAG: aromatic amino acid lyase, partial [Paracoccaceae bacterium]
VTDSTPTSANQEDHVSMAAHGARRLQRMIKNLDRILGVELLCAAQGIEFRAPFKTSAPLQSVIERLRQDVPTLNEDRYLAPELEVVHALVSNAEIIAAAGMNMPEFGT